MQLMTLRSHCQASSAKHFLWLVFEWTGSGYWWQRCRRFQLPFAAAVCHATCNRVFTPGGRRQPHPWCPLPQCHLEVRCQLWSAWHPIRDDHQGSCWANAATTAYPQASEPWHLFHPPLLTYGNLLRAKFQLPAWLIYLEYMATRRQPVLAFLGAVAHPEMVCQFPFNSGQHSFLRVPPTLLVGDSIKTSDIVQFDI